MYFNLQWLEKDFMPYLDLWEESVEGRNGFTVIQKKRMLLSTETLLGIRRTGMCIHKLKVTVFVLSGADE